MTTEMQEIPTAQYYTATDHTVAKLIRLIAILSIIIGAAGLLQIGMALGSLLLDNSQIGNPFRGMPMFYTVTTLADWVLISPLKLASGIGCLHRKEWARRGMMVVAILMIIGSAVFNGLYSYQLIAYRVSPFGPGMGVSIFAQAIPTLRITSSFVACLLLPLLMLALFRSAEAKQFFFKKEI